MKNDGYLRFPTLYEDKVVFVTEDDLWAVPIEGGLASRLTNTPGVINYPHFSPDGKYIAFSAADDGPSQVYVMPFPEGEAKRLVYHPANALVVGWHPTNGKILFRGALDAANPRQEEIYAVSPEGGAWEKLNIGIATTVTFEEDGDHLVIQRGYPDPAVWKRYHGGRTGRLWYGNLKNLEFHRLTSDQKVEVSPFFYEGRIYFLSDCNGIANFYSYKTDGSDTRQHTFHKDFYVRWPQIYKNIVVYQMAGELWKLDLATDKTEKIPVQLQSCGYTLRKKFVPPGRNLTDFALSPKHDRMLINTRGLLSIAPVWEGPVSYMGETTGVRHKLCRWMPDNTRILAVNDEKGEEEVVLYSYPEIEVKKRFGKIGEGGYIQQVVPSPKGELAAIATSSRLYILNLESGDATFVGESNHRYFREFSWSPDGQWLVYAKYEGEFNYASLYLYSIESKITKRITMGDAHDYCPCFDPKGRYIYFLSKRVFNPYEDSLQNDYNFPATSRPYLLVLKASEYSPFSSTGSLDKIEEEEKPKEKEEKAKEEKEEKKVEIDLDGLEDRIQEIPIKEGRYLALSVAEDKVFILEKPIKGELSDTPFWMASTRSDFRFFYYDLKERKEKNISTKISNFSHNYPYKKMVLQFGNRLRVVKAGEEIKEEADSKPGKENGWFDLERVRVMIDPRAEWLQMLKEGWRWQRDFYWRSDMNGLDWQKVLDKYLLVFEKVRTRQELGDLLWEIYGELGTSHAYVMMGESPVIPIYRVGVLGADIQLDPATHKYQIKRIYQGDLSHQEHRSPLSQPGIRVKEGDYLLKINGKKLSPPEHPYEHLLNMAGQEVLLSVCSQADEKDAREVVVTTLASELPVRYHQWVKDNREYIARKTQDRVGYLHVPDMGMEGLISFHKDFLWQFNKKGLIVDVRHNAGGHVSQVLLSKLQRRALGYCSPRKGELECYPYQTLRGPIVALCDEFTGSDGDIFCQAFKDLQLGTLIGKRTWGGVVGIMCDKRLVDGGLLTQPEFAFWFKSRDWAVENNGVVPDIEVEYDPASYAQGKDPQLDRAIEEILKQMETYKEELPKFDLPVSKE